MKPFILLSIVLLFATTQAARAGAEQWAEVRSDHFRLITNSSEKDGRHVLDQLERMRWVFQTLFPKMQVDPAAPIQVIAAKNEKTFQAIEPAAYLAKGQVHLGGLFLRMGEKNYILLRLDSPDEQHPFAAIYHEYTHLQLSSADAWIPLWANEGLAEFFQNTKIQNKEVWLGMPDFDEMGFLNRSRMIPLAELFRIDQHSPYYHEESKGNIFYAESWALTHYLQIKGREAGKDLMGAYLNLVAHHVDSVAAATQVFGDLKQLEKDLGMYTVASNYKYFVLKSAVAPIDENAFKARPLTAGEADALRADVLFGVGRKCEANALIDSVLKAEPNSALALESRGMMLFEAGNHNEARNFLDQAVKANSPSYQAWYYDAMLNSEAGDPAHDAQAEAALRGAIQLNPHFAVGCDALASFLGRRHQNLDEARAFAQKAIELEPGNFTYRMNEANLLESNDRLDDAEAVLKEALRLSTSANNKTIFQNRLDALTEERKRREQFAKGGTGDEPRVINTQEVVKVDPHPPAHPGMPANGRRHAITGVLRKVSCSYPTVIEFSVESAGKTVKLYNNNFVELDLSALGFKPDASMDPCHQFEGRRARVDYVDTTDKSMDGQAMAVELHK